MGYKEAPDRQAGSSLARLESRSSSDQGPLSYWVDASGHESADKTAAADSNLNRDAGQWKIAVDQFAVPHLAGLALELGRLIGLGLTPSVLRANDPRINDSLGLAQPKPLR